MGKRILFITHQLSRTGAPIVLIDMIKLCVHRGFHADVISMMDGELRVELEEMGLTPQIIDRFFPERERFIKEWEDYDLVVANTLITYEAVHVINGSNIPVLWWLHEGVQYFQYFKSVIPDFNELGENVHPYAVSPYVKAVVKDIYGCDIPMLHFAVDGYNGKAEEHYKERADKIRFLTAGTFSKIKGQDVLVQAIKMLPAEYIGKTEFSFCGNETCVDEDVYGSVCRLADEYDNVNMLHQLTRQETIKQMELADCLIVPSRVEPLPTVAIEMMMTGGVVMCTNVCGISYYIEDGKNGLVVDADNPYALAENIMKITDERNQLEQMGKESHMTYESHFSRESVEPEMLGVIEGLIGKSEHKRIVFVKGKLETLDYFMDQLIEGAMELGCECYVVNINNTETYEGNSLDEFISGGNCAAFFINQIGLLLNMNGENFWNKNNIPVFNLIVDHPYNFSDAFDYPPTDIDVVVIDKNHETFIKNYYPRIKNIHFMPNGGNEVSGKLPYCERPIDVLYVGDCQGSTPFLKVKDMPDEGIEMFTVVYNMLIQNPQLTIEKAMEIYFDTKTGYSKEQIKKYIINYGFIISDNIRRYYKLRTMHAIESTGAVIEIYGNGWNIEGEQWGENVHIHSRVSSEECNRLLGKAKIGLNCMPWFKDGCSERVFNIMLNGALCLTDTSKYLLKRFEHGNELVFYNLDDMDELRENVLWLLKNPKAAVMIAQKGYKVASQNDTWKCRMKRILEMMEGGE